MTYFTPVFSGFPTSFRVEWWPFCYSKYRLITSINDLLNTVWVRNPGYRPTVVAKNTVNREVLFWPYFQSNSRYNCSADPSVADSNHCLLKLYPILTTNTAYSNHCWPSLTVTTSKSRDKGWKLFQSNFESPINLYLNVNKNASFPASGVEILPSCHQL